MGYVIEHKGKKFSPNGEVDIVDVDGFNQRLDKEILDEWATQPDKAGVYVSDTMVTTWLGEKMGTIIYRNTYKNNLGKTITYLRIRGTNNAVYYGSYGSDWTQFCKVTKARSFKC